MCLGIQDFVSDESWYVEWVDEINKDLVIDFCFG